MLIDPVEYKVDSEKEDTIKKIIDQHRTQFEAWIENNKGKSIFEIPEQLLAVFIPEALYAQVEDPQRLKTRRLDAETLKTKSLRFIIFETLDTPVTNSVIWEKHLETLAQLKRKAKETGDSNLLKSLKKPEGIDPFHLELKDSISRQEITFNDRVYIDVVLGNRVRANPNNLFFSNYFDHPDYRRRGISTNFYQNAREIIKKLGFHFITGLINPNNFSFFVDRLGQIPLSQVRQDKRKDIMGNDYDPALTPYYAVDFLQDKDKARYLSRSQHD